MKKLLSLVIVLSFFSTGQSQELALMTSHQVKGNQAREAQPVESYWFEQNLEPLNYQLVLSSITYDSRALEASAEGTVLLQVMVDENGLYQGHSIMNEANPLLVAAVEQKAHYLAFPKPVMNGQPASALVTVPFRFRLTDGW